MNFIKKITLSFLILFTSSLSYADFIGTVVAIHDGDTINVQTAGIKKAVRVRLWGIDSPEVDFNGNSQGASAFESRDFLRSLLPIGSQVKVVTGSQVTDKNSRTLGIVFYAGENLNLKMLEAGQALLYVIAPYEKDNIVEFSLACHIAAESKVGLFSHAYQNVMEPYNFRLKVQKYYGTNLMGDLSTKKLVEYKSQGLVHPCDRVFFPTLEMAKGKGFQN